MRVPFWRTLGIALALPLLCAACLFPSLTRTSGWETSETFDKTYDTVWEAVLEGTKNDGNFWKISEANKDDGTIETEWQVKNLRYEVTRRRMEVQIVPDGEGYAVKVRVFKERVFLPRAFDTKHPDDADWEWYGYDEEGPAGLFKMIHPSLRNYD